MNSSVGALGQFLGDFRTIQEVAHRNSRVAMSEFIQRARSIGDVIREGRRRSAERFNVFEAVGFSDGELQHSLFLSHLLNPRESHDQGAFFLCSFLDHFGLSHMKPREGDPGIFVQKEYPIQGGRIDIVLFLGASGIVCIENKVWAQEQESQVARYQQWVGRSLGAGAYGCILFLTPDGRKAKSMVGVADVAESPAVPVRLISYADIGTWLSGVRGDVPGSIAAILQMYCRLCEKIAEAAGGLANRSKGAEMTIREDVLAFLGQPGHLSTAYDVRDWLSEVERQVFMTFWSGVEERLTHLLVTSGYVKEWQIRSSAWPAIDDKSYIAIAPVRADPTSLCFGQVHYTVSVQCLLNTGTTGCYFGVFRGARKSAKLDRSLNEEQFRSNGFWSGWKSTNKAHLPDFRLIRDNVLLLNSDNHSPDRRLVQTMASHLWTLFERHRSELESLNREIDEVSGV